MYCVHTYVRTSQSCRLQYVVYLGTQPRRTAVKLTVGVNWAKRLHHDVFEGDTGGQMVIHEAYHVWGGRWEWQEVWQGARTEWQSSSMSQTKWQHGMTLWYSDKLHESSTKVVRTYKWSDKVDKHVWCSKTNTGRHYRYTTQSPQSSPYPKEVNTIPHTRSPSDHKERTLALTQRHHCMLYRLAIHWW